jgi:hypothetical protein
MGNVSNIIGLDLGQQVDYSVLSVLEVERQYLRGTGSNYNLRFFHKFPLKTPYQAVVNYTAWFVEKAFYGRDYIIIVDATGVGRPIIDLFRVGDLAVVALTITGGIRANWRSRTEVVVPKRELVSSLLSVFQSYRLKIADNIKHRRELEQELINFQPKIVSQDLVTLEGRGGYHDDFVLSISYATWYGEYVTRGGRKLRIISG